MESTELPPQGVPASSPAPSIAPEADTPAPYVPFEGVAGPDPRDCSAMSVADGLVRIVDVEGPMLAKRAYDLYLRSNGIRRLGPELKRLLNRALHKAISLGSIVTEDEMGNGGLLYSIVRTPSTHAVVLRNRGARDFDEIPPSELQLVARRIAQASGLARGSEAHLRAVLAFLDLKRLTPQVESRLRDVLQRSFPYVDEFLERAVDVSSSLPTPAPGTNSPSTSGAAHSEVQPKPQHPSPERP